MAQEKICEEMTDKCNDCHKKQYCTIWKPKWRKQGKDKRRKS